MKKILYILLLIVPFFYFSNCTSDSESNPKFGDDEIYLYGDWLANRAYKVGDKASIKGMQFISTGSEYTYKWIFDGEVVSTDKDLVDFPLNNKLFNVPLQYIVTSSTGAVASRNSKIVIREDFVPLTPTYRSVGFVTPNTVLDDIDWPNLTHLIYSTAVVKEGGTLNVEPEMDVPTLLGYARYHGVYVLIEFSGIVNYLKDGPAYQSYTFYNAAVANPEKLADAIVAKATELEFDGINIAMDKANTDNGDFANAVKLTEFYKHVATKLKSKNNEIDKKEYPYLTTLSAWGGWTRGSIRAAAKLTEYDWLNISAYGNENTEPQEHSGTWFAEGEANAWMTGWIGPIAANRIVLVTPAFGLRYFGIPATYTWPNLETMTEYMSYDDICEANADAHTKNKVFKIDYTGDKTKEVNVTYYNGLPAAKARAEFAKTKGLAGIGLWSLESDSKDPSKALLKEINTTLGN